jgi:hypothetical protein
MSDSVGWGDDRSPRHKNAVIYGLGLESFIDSYGDSIGDFEGLTGCARASRR